MNYKQRQFRMRLSRARQKVTALESECNHCVSRASKSSIRLHRTLGNVKQAICFVCDKKLGNLCYKSPDGVCHYFTRLDKQMMYHVKLINGEMDYNFPKVHWNSASHESTERCIYCGDSQIVDEND